MLAQIKQKRLWRGVDRGRLRKLQKALIMMSQRDQKMAAYQAATFNPGFYFDDSPVGAITTAMQLLLSRIDAALIQKE